MEKRKEIIMIEKDTIKLLRECDSGVKMGISSIDDVLDKVKNQDFRKLLYDCKKAHEDLETEIESELRRFCDEGKDPNPVAKSMSWMKTNMMLMVNDCDGTIADLMTDGCNMGVKSLHRYLNQYSAAEEKAKDICKRLINLEETLAVDIRIYL
jgi:hypothetical protein